MSRNLKNKLNAVSAGHGFEVVLSYEDGSRFLLNVAETVDRGPWTKELRNRKMFETVSPTPHGGLEWANGFDVAPEYVRAHSKPL